MRPAYRHLAVVSTPQNLRLWVAAHPAGELRRLIREDRLVRRLGQEVRLHYEDRARIWLENPDSAGGGRVHPELRPAAFHRIPNGSVVTNWHADVIYLT